jgi:hypothetical protein
VHKSFFTDIQISTAGPALPVIWLPKYQVLVEEVVIRECPEAWLSFAQYLVIDSPFSVLEWLKLAAGVVNDADRRLKPQFQCPAGNNCRILRVAHSAPEHRIDVDIELRELGQPL